MIDYSDINNYQVGMKVVYYAGKTGRITNVYPESNMFRVNYGGDCVTSELHHLALNKQWEFLDGALYFDHSLIPDPYINMEDLDNYPIGMPVVSCINKKGKIVEKTPKTGDTEQDGFTILWETCDYSYAVLCSWDCRCSTEYANEHGHWEISNGTLYLNHNMIPKQRKRITFEEACKIITDDAEKAEKERLEQYRKDSEIKTALNDERNME